MERNRLTPNARRGRFPIRLTTPAPLATIWHRNCQTLVRGLRRNRKTVNLRFYKHHPYDARAAKTRVARRPTSAKGRLATPAPVSHLQERKLAAFQNPTPSTHKNASWPFSDSGVARPATERLHKGDYKSIGPSVVSRIEKRPPIACRDSDLRSTPSSTSTPTPTN